MTTAPHDPLAAFFAAAPLVVLDGALATELERRGADLNDPLWSARLLIEQPDLVREVHLDYFRAGADVATTASYQATFEAFARRGLSHDEAAGLMRRSVALAVEAREAFWAEPGHRIGRRRPLVAASVGPYGAMLADGAEYRGRYGLDERQLRDFHRPRLAVLAASGADLLAVETVPCRIEAEAIARLLADEFPQAAAWIAFSCRDGAHVNEGQRLADCAAALDGIAQVVAVGVNCTPPQFVGSLIDEIRSATRKPVVVYPNSGETWDGAHKCWRGDPTLAAYDDLAAGWLARGARLIGGCCRTTPADIAALSRRLR